MVGRLAIAAALLAVAGCASTGETTNEAPIEPTSTGAAAQGDEDCELYWYQRGTDQTRAIWQNFRLSDDSAILGAGPGAGPLPFRPAVQSFSLLLDSVGNFWRKDLAVEAVAAFFRDFSARYPGRAAEADNGDLLWWAIACMRASRITNDKFYHLEGKAIYDRLWGTQVDNALDGGMWSRGDVHDEKGAEVNFAAAIAALELYAGTKDVKYLLQGRKLYAWAADRLYSPETGELADCLTAGGETRRGEAARRSGAFIGASLRLYRATGTRMYLVNASAAADRLVDVQSAHGVLRPDAHQGGARCSGTAVRYLSELARRPSCARYREYLLSNSRAAWTSRRLADGLNGPDWSKPPTDAETIEPSSPLAAAMLYFATSRAFR